MPSQLARFYQRASLPVKVSLPFTLMFCIFWILGSSALGNYFNGKLERQKRAQITESATLLKQDIDKELDGLRQYARLLVTKQSIVEAVEQQEISQLRQEFLPLTSILNTDIIDVVGSEGSSIFSAREHELNNVDIYNQRLINLVLTGSDLSEVISLKNPNQALLVGTAPVKNDQGIIGGILLSKIIDNAFVTQLSKSIDGEIIILTADIIVASSFPEEEAVVAENLLEPVPQHGADTSINGEIFLTEHIHFEDMNGTPLDVVLLSSNQPLVRAQQLIWLLVASITLLGVLLTSIIGYYLANAVSKPICELSKISQQVIAEGNFEIQSSITRSDEIGTLSNDLNQLIRWVKSYTDKLEKSTQTLELRVQERTQELASALSELQDMQSQLIQTEKMSSLGSMVAGIAHEINNPISFIHGNLKPLTHNIDDLTDLLSSYEEEYPNPSDAIAEKREDLDIDFVIEDIAKICSSIKVGTSRVREIVISLRNYSRLDEAAVKEVNLCEGLDSTLLILGHRLKEDIAIVKQYEPLPLVKCSPAQLNQVFTNIIANAIDAMVDAATEPKQLTLTTHICEADQVQISIKDNGPGMPPEIQAKIFDPFFTTKAVGKGTGLGLGICFKIIEQHQGKLEVISAVGQGTEFLITLPINSPKK